MSDLPDDAVTELAMTKLAFERTIRDHIHLSCKDLGHFDAVVAELCALADAIAARAAAGERERANKLAKLASDLLRRFWESGHPGMPCHRTGWVDDDQLGAWHKQLADLIGEAP